MNLSLFSAKIDYRFEFSPRFWPFFVKYAVFDFFYFCLIFRVVLTNSSSSQKKRVQSLMQL